MFHYPGKRRRRGPDDSGGGGSSPPPAAAAVGDGDGQQQQQQQQQQRQQHGWGGAHLSANEIQSFRGSILFGIFSISTYIKFKYFRMKNQL